MPYAAYHFHRLAPYGVLANLLAMPVISALSMPAGLLALVAMPFGFDGPLWRLMGVGIDWMIMVATWVAHLPGAVGHIPAFGIGALLLATAGLIVLCLLRSPLRFAGAGLAAAGCMAALMAARPDVLISAAGEVVARARRATAASPCSSPATMTRSRSATGSMPTATRALPPIARLAQGFACDPDGCVGPPRRRRHHRGGAQPGRARRRLQPRCPGRDAPPAAAGLRRHGGRPQARCEAPAPWRCFIATGISMWWRAGRADSIAHGPDATRPAKCGRSLVRLPGRHPTRHRMPMWKSDIRRVTADRVAQSPDGGF